MPRHILLCDDEVHILRAAEYKLKRSGYSVELAADGEEAWEAIKARMPDILITDYQMPRLDGFGLVQRIRDNSETADLPILMLTAKGFELSHKELARQWKVFKVLAKPFSPRELGQIVDDLFAQEGQADQQTLHSGT